MSVGISRKRIMFIIAAAVVMTICLTIPCFAGTEDYTAGSSMKEEQDADDGGMRLMAAAPWSKNSNGTYNNGNGVLLKGAVAKGIDVSKHQGNIKWNKVKGSGIDYVILRCGYRDSKGKLHTDEKWNVNVAACEKYKIPYGVYFYSTAKSDKQVKEEINKVKTLLKGHHPDYPVYYDLEDPKRLQKQGKAFISKAGLSFCKSIKSAGYKSGVYASKNWWDRYLTSSSYNAYERWVAQWRAGGCTYTKGYSMWQCTSNYRSVDGIYEKNGKKARVDLDFAYKDFYQTPGEWTTDENGEPIFMTYVENEDGTYDTEQPMIMAVSCFVRTGGYYYYVGEDGHKYKGLQYIDNKRYYFSGSGIMKKSGWINYEGGSYFASSTGVLYNNSLKKVSNYYYLFAADGKRFGGGTHELNGKVYKLMSNGKAYLNISKAKYKTKFKKGPGKKYKNKGTLKRGKSVYIIRTYGSWSQASNGYWIKTKHLKKVKSYPYNAPAKPVQTEPSTSPTEPSTVEPTENKANQETGEMQKETQSDSSGGLNHLTEQ